MKKSRNKSRDGWDSRSVGLVILDAALLGAVIFAFAVLLACVAV